MKIWEYDSHGTLVLKGQYAASLDTLTKYVRTIEIDIDNFFGEENNYISAHSYFQPLRDGLWEIRNDRGEFEKVKYKLRIQENK